MAPSFPHEAYIGLGSNLGDPVHELREALAALDVAPSTTVISCSSFYRTAPVGYLDQPDFVNAVVRLRTGLEPEALLQVLLAQEQHRGRQRTVRNGPRTLDLDLLLFDDVRTDTAELTLPHPRMHERAFVLMPLVEIAPEIAIPGRGRAASLLAALGSSGVERMAA